MARQSVLIGRLICRPALYIRTSVLPLRLERNHGARVRCELVLGSMYVMHKHSRHRKCSPARNSVCAHNHEATAEIGSSDRSCARPCTTRSAAMRPVSTSPTNPRPPWRACRSTIRTTAPNSAAPVTGPAWSCTAPTSSATPSSPIPTTPSGWAPSNPAWSASYRGADHLAPSGSVVLMNPDELHTGRAETEGGWRYRMATSTPTWSRA